jgi:predicted AlkP superfamily pyrophosphatase or phosphodiesterase
MSPDFVEPFYDSRGFASLPATITNLLTGGRYQAVVLLLIDGFGWRFFERFVGTPFLQEVTRLGQAAKLRSQFPSTTAAHITTIHTGLAVGEHGLFEWNYYEPDLDAVITPLLFSYAGTPQRDTLKAAGVKPRSLFPLQPIYRGLKKKGIQASILQHREYTPSTYSDVVFAGAAARGYKTLAEALVNLSGGLAAVRTPAYFFLYFDKIDAICHEYGPGSPQAEAEILTFLTTMEQVLLKRLPASHPKTLFLLTADHGQAETDPATTVYLNRAPQFEGIERYLRLDRAGRPIVAAGSPRDFFLYIREGLIDEAQAFLARGLEGRAEVRRVADLAEAGYFGPVVSPAFRGRAGDLVILPYRGESVWWYEKDKFEQRYYGHHGGLTPEEMEIPLVLWEM